MFSSPFFFPHPTAPPISRRYCAHHFTIMVLSSCSTLCTRDVVVATAPPPPSRRSTGSSDQRQCVVGPTIDPVVDIVSPPSPPSPAAAVIVDVVVAMVLLLRRDATHVPSGLVFMYPSMHHAAPGALPSASKHRFGPPSGKDTR